jgi:hypothetical protein
MVESPLNLERLNAVVLSNPKLEEELAERAKRRQTDASEALDQFLTSILNTSYT